MEPVRFLHTADWQLGMQRHFLTEEAAPRFEQARIDVLREIGRVAGERGCEFVVAAGDLFESNHVHRRTVARTLEALGSFEMPVFILPGNHDPLDAASVYRSKEFRANAPAHLHLLDNTEPIEVRPGVEVHGVPWTARKARRDLVADALAGLSPHENGVRIGVAHGIVDALSPDRDDPAMIRLGGVQAALADGRLHFLALGDRHSVTEVAARVWYSGAPEATDYDETDSGCVLVVELAADRSDVERVPVGRWRFVEEPFELDSDDTLDALEAWLDARPAKDTTILKLRLRGTLSLAQRARLNEKLARTRELFGGLQERLDGLELTPDELDFDRLGLAGFARAAVEELARPDAPEQARDALVLLHRLARETAS